MLQSCVLARGPKRPRFVFRALFIALALLLAGASAAPQFGMRVAMAAPILGTAQNYRVLGGSTVTNTGPTTLSGGNLGVNPGSTITGFPPGIVGAPGTIHAADAGAAQAQSDVTTAYNSLAGRARTATLTGQDLGGLTLTHGVYFFASAAQLTGQLILDAKGNPNAVFVFQIGSTLTTASNASVRMINAASACNVYWQVGSSATLGTTTTFVGSILALTSITLTTGAAISGRVLARNGAVTLDTNTISARGCAPVIPPTATAVPPTTPPPASMATGTPVLSTEIPTTLRPITKIPTSPTAPPPPSIAATETSMRPTGTAPVPIPGLPDTGSGRVARFRAAFGADIEPGTAGILWVIIGGLVALGGMGLFLVRRGRR